ncbi:MAG TPA: thiamine phosphate synthase [Polyangiaceae bacterium]|nr:thiamine phosphate synthase [Polyangiaceae bacterium]
MAPSGLYPILDVDSLRARSLDILAFAGAVLAARPAVVQLRAKSSSARDTLALLSALAPICQRAGTTLFANDRPDLALLAGAPGVHVGQDDLPLAEVRRFAPALLVGVSTHSLAELERALDERPAYVAFGPVFATASKADHEPCVGLDGLRAAHERAAHAGVPLVAIGGIDLTRAEAAAPHAEAAAVIGALLPVTTPDGRAALDEVTERARALDAVLRRGRPEARATRQGP